MYACLYAGVFLLKYSVLTVHCPFIGTGLGGHRPLGSLHLVAAAAHHNVAAHTAVLHALETQLAQGTTQVDGRQLLRDVGTDNLHGTGHTHEHAWLGSRRSAEVQGGQLILQLRCLELAPFLLRFVVQVVHVVVFIWSVKHGAKVRRTDKKYPPYTGDMYGGIFRSE